MCVSVCVYVCPRAQRRVPATRRCEAGGGGAAISTASSRALRFPQSLEPFLRLTFTTNREERPHSATQHSVGGRVCRSVAGEGETTHRSL